MTVVIPAHNATAFLGEALRSALDQTFEDLEIVVVDDGSTDATAALAASFGEVVRVILQPNRGPAAARNRGIREARGRFIAFLDADDLWDAEMVSSQVAALEADPAIGLVSTNCWYTDGRRLVPVVRTAQRIAHSGHVYRRLVRENFIVTSTVMARRECLDAVGGFDEALHVSEDYDLWLRLSRVYPFRFLDRPLARYRIHTQGAFGNLEKRLTARIRIFDKLATERDPAFLLEPRELRDIRAAYLRHIASIYLSGRNTGRARTLLEQARQLGGRPAGDAIARLVTWMPEPMLNLLRRLRVAIVRPPSVLEAFRTEPAAAASARSPEPRHAAGARIAFVSQLYPPEFSGAGVQASRLAAALQRRGYQVTVLTRALRGCTQHQQADEDGVRVVRIAKHPALPDGPLRRRAWAFGAVWALWRTPADILHFHGASELEPLIAIGLLRRAPVIVKLPLTAARVPSRGGRTDRWKRVRRQLVRRAARVVAMSGHLVEDCRDDGVPPERVLRIPNGVDLRSFHPLSPEERARLRWRLGLPPEGALMVTLGRISERKRQKIQVRALAMLRLEGVEATLLCAGPRALPYADELQADAERLGVADRVILREFEHPDAARRALQAASVFTLTSVREGQPNSLLEAMGCGLPVVSSTLPGITDEILVDGRSGILLRETTETALAAAWRWLLSHPEEANALGEAARRWAEEQHDLERIADRYAATYTALLGRGDHAAAAAERER